MTDADSYPNQGTLHRERMRFERDFTQLPNAWLRDKRLSFRARGLLAHLMSHDAGYKVSVAGLVAATMAEGKDALRPAITELERCGYLHRIKERTRGRFSGYVWVLQDPFAAHHAHSEPTLWPVDNPPSPERVSRRGESADGGFADAVNPPTIEDQVKNISGTSVSHESLDAPVDNFGRVRWADERCPGNWRDRKHDLNQHGMCRHCHARPTVRSAS